MPHNNEQNKKEELEKKIGRVIEVLPTALFRVRFDDNQELICFLKGKIKKIFKIKIWVGDMVEVEIDPYGGKGRIIKRL